MVQQIEKIIGAKYSGGNILLKHGILYFSVGKYVSTYDYTNLRSEVLQIANSTNISILSMSSCGKFLLTVDFLGCICILNLQKKVTIMKILSSNEIKVPKTYKCQLGKERDFLERFENELFSVNKLYVLKPADSQGSKGVYIIDSKKQKSKNVYIYVNNKIFKKKDKQTKLKR